jgi:hypothetical protein
MSISGFTMVRNGAKLYYPVKEAILSILPIVDEFVVALGNCDADDNTLQEIESIGSEKIKIIRTVWDLEKYTGGTEYAHQTDIAKEACKGDWLFYIQCDEVLHEKYLPAVHKRCEELLHDEEVEGLLFDYRHFWGDYNHYIVSHTWYAKEIRIIRNRKDIHSWRDAQSFRRIPDFDDSKYLSKERTFKLKVADTHACIYHYGMVRPPVYMQKKRKAFASAYIGENKAQQAFEDAEEKFNYGNLNKLNIMKEPHPAVMQNMIERFHWADQLYPNVPLDHQQHKHEKLKNRLLSFVEKNILGGEQIFTFKNYELLKGR